MNKQETINQFLNFFQDNYNSEKVQDFSEDLLKLNRYLENGYSYQVKVVSKNYKGIYVFYSSFCYWQNKNRYNFVVEIK